MAQIATCKISGKQFEILPQEEKFCERMGFPLPGIHPKERLRKLFATRNEWKLYKRKCDKTGKEILSAYKPDCGFKVYDNPIWWGDSWDGLDYGQEFDFSKPFFDQFASLQLNVPREGTTIFNSENCEYNSHIRNSKNCYLNSLVAKCEDALYSYWIVENKDIMDCLYTNYSTLCYWCSDVNHCFNCTHLRESVDCIDCFFSYQLRGCNHCIFSSNLANKSYYAFNKPCTKEKFEEIKAKALDGSQESLKKAQKEYKELLKKTPHRHLHNLKCENCTGDHLYNAKNCFESFDGNDGEDCYNLVSLDHSKDVHNIYSAGWPGCEVLYYCCVTRGSQDCAFCTYTFFGSGLRYCDSCISCKNCFGCIGLQHKEYCVLNKQYPKTEYEKLTAKIIKHMEKTNEWGQFFPPSLSPFAYNETGAQDFFPLTKEEAIKLGFKWLDENKKDYLPATKEMLACEKCKKNYKLIPQELKFYKQMSLPTPLLCPSCRHEERFRERSENSLYNRTCDNCKKPMLTTLPPKSPYVVYCEKCYLDSVD